MYKYLILWCLWCFFIGCDTESGEKIDLSKRENIPMVNITPQSAETLKVAVGGMISPKENLIHYGRLLQYLGNKLNRKIEFVQRESYKEVNDLLKEKKISLAFVCTGPYVQGKRDFGMELLVAPIVNGQHWYYAYLIVPHDSPAKELKDLREKSFAFTDPYSNTGKLVPTYWLTKLGETPESFFKKIIYTHNHDLAIQAVAEKLVDGAAVDSLIYEYKAKQQPKPINKVKVIRKSKPFGIPPIVTHPDINPNLKEKLKLILLNIHKDLQGKAIISSLGIEKFVEAEDSWYDSVREMGKIIEDKHGFKEK